MEGEHSPYRRLIRRERFSQRFYEVQKLYYSIFYKGPSLTPASSLPNTVTTDIQTGVGGGCLKEEAIFSFSCVLKSLFSVHCLSFDFVCGLLLLLQYN